MTFDKKTWVNVPDPAKYAGDLNSLPRFDADNMNRIEEGIEEVEKNRQILSYVSFSDVGQTIGEETIDGIVDGMPNNSILYTGISTSNAKIYPNSYGTLKVTKRDSSRVIFEFFNKSTNINYIGSYDNTKTYKWSGWEKVLTTGTASPDDVGAAPSGHGLGTYPEPYNENMVNSIREVLRYGSGFYQVDRFPDNPTHDAAWKPMLQLALGDISGVQLLMPYLNFNGEEASPSPKMMLRSIFEGATSDWVEMLHSGNTADLLSGEELWKNADPSSDFAAQTIPLDLTEYKRIAVEVDDGNERGICYKKDETYRVWDHVVNDRYRTISFNDSGVRISAAQQGLNSSNTRVIPFKIIGYKYGGDS